MLCFAAGTGAQVSSGAVSNVNAVQAFQQYQRWANYLYRQEDYQQAHRHYLRLAENGDKHAQFKLAEMYAQGRGVERDIVEAYAWSSVAIESDNQYYRKTHRELSEQLDTQQLKQAEKTAAEKVDKYGAYRTAVKARREVAKQRRRCTGSLTGNTCDRVQASSLSCQASGSRVPSKVCIILGSVGLESVVGQQLQDIRKVEKALDQLIAELKPDR